MVRTHKEEEFARGLVARVLDVEAEVWDVGGRQGAYDVRLSYPDGRVGAMEVTTVAEPGRRQLESLLGRDNFGWETCPLTQPQQGIVDRTAGAGGDDHRSALRAVAAQPGNVGVSEHRHRGVEYQP